MDTNTLLRLPGVDGVAERLHLDVGVPLFKPLLTDTLIFDFQAYELSVVQRAVVGAAAGVERMELGTWDIEAARRANAAVQKGQ